MADTETRWGILTDGKRWRLLNKDSRSDRYFEIDLYDITLRSDREEWLYFYNLFRREAFIEHRGKCLLDLVKEESARYSQDVGEELKERVYLALRELAQGFTAWPENGIDPSQDEARELLRESCFVLLYRLLFVFYAEARGLLPVESDGYGRISLETLRDRVKGASRDGSRFLPDSRQFWTGLKDLFRLIDRGSESLGIPPYNGGLFSREFGGSRPAAFLEGNDIGDRYLAKAIDFLGTAPSLENRGEFVGIDYAGLDIRHLGSIYEGLLEYRLRYAETDLVAIRERGKEIWVPLAEYKRKLPPGASSGQVLIRKGDLYLETERHERRGSGSYSTPDHVVKHIVSNALSPVIQKKLKAARESRRKRSEAILSIRVCDPAMGSGHFLVETTEFLAEALVPAVEEDQKLGFLPQMEYGQGLAKREVVGHCIYGVDQNELAVELAKVSLWLSTISKDRPLSFLDHHLKCGNSLLGAKVDDLPWLPGQRPRGAKSQVDKPLGLVQKILDRLRELDAIPDESVGAIKRKERIVQELKKSAEYRRIVGLADVHLGLHFTRLDNETIRKRYMDLVNEAYYGSEEAWERKFNASWAQEAAKEAKRWNFFHWELEFPEVFFEAGRPKKRPGFDAVIGNPPYDELSEHSLGRPIEEMAAYKADATLKQGLGGRPNLFRLFIARAIDMTAPGGYHGFIVPMAFLADKFSENLRRNVLPNVQIVLVEAFPQKDDPKRRVFPEAKLPTCLYIMRREEPGEKFRVRTHPGRYILDESPAYEATFEDIQEFDPKGYSIPTLDSDSWSLVRKIYRTKGLVRMATVCKPRPGEIMINKQFRKFLTEDPTPDLVLRGAHIGRYEFNETPKQGDPVYLKKDLYLKERGNSKKAYDHRTQRIGFQRGSALDNWRRIIATMLPSGAVCSDTVGYITRPDSKYSLEYILAFLNASLSEWRFRLTSSTNHVNPYEIEQLPIREIEFHTPEGEKEDCLRELRDSYHEYLRQGELAQLGKAVNDLLRSRRTDVLHDYLSWLAKEMLRIHETKNLEVKGFWDWVEGWTGGVIDEWKLKTKVHTYYSMTLRDFVDVLRKNAPKIKIDPLGRQEFARLKAAFEQSKSTIRSLSAQAALTDRIIDFIVYRLCGLTPTEIAVVEGKDEAEVIRKYAFLSHAAG
jgi:type I restriction-modification system DNA methylase subunit